MFQTNQAKFFERLKKENRINNVRPESQESVKFWCGIWDQVRHNVAQLLKKIERQLRVAKK